MLVEEIRRNGMYVLTMINPAVIPGDFTVKVLKIIGLDDVKGSDVYDLQQQQVLGSFDINATFIKVELPNGSVRILAYGWIDTVEPILSDQLYTITVSNLNNVKSDELKQLLIALKYEVNVATV